jgi:hypothetical protein
MNLPINSPRFWILIVGVVYVIVGYGSALLDPSVPAQMRFTWRLAAWVGCGAVYVAHVAYEHFRLRSRSFVTALHVALAVAFGACLLAIAATIHAATVPSHAPLWQFLIALIAWPIITAVPAFVVALAIAAVLGRFPRKRLAE